eukprot:6172430-Pleurochrysis_carterae.AAC.1
MTGRCPTPNRAGSWRPASCGLPEAGSGHFYRPFVNVYQYLLQVLRLKCASLRPFSSDAFYGRRHQMVAGVRAIADQNSDIVVFQVHRRVWVEEHTTKRLFSLRPLNPSNWHCTESRIDITNLWCFALACNINAMESLEARRIERVKVQADGTSLQTVIGM